MDSSTEGKQVIRWNLSFFRMMGILAKLMIVIGGFFTVGAGIGFGTGLAEGAEVQIIAIYLMIGIATLIGGLILREHQKGKSPQIAS
jgi:hypothetical protein